MALKHLCLMLLTLTALSCHKQELGNYYFDFDSVDHYSIVLNHQNFSSLSAISGSTKNKKLKEDLVYNGIPSSLKDTIFISKLNRLGYEKKVLNESKLDSINELFRFKTHKETKALSCAPVFRDILIFRKNGKVEGMAKICFECNQSLVIGTSENTSEFGQSGDYGKLWRILKD